MSKTYNILVSKVERKLNRRSIFTVLKNGILSAYLYRPDISMHILKARQLVYIEFDYKKITYHKIFKSDVNIWRIMRFINKLNKLKR